MDHSLLPIPEKKALRHEYRVRMLIVAFFMISLSFFVGVVAILPSFVKSTFTLSDARRVTAEIQAKDDPNAAMIEKTLAIDKVLVGVIESSGDKVRLSILLDNIVSLRETTRITSISLTRSASTTISIGIQGIAPTREVLLSFRDRLQTQIAQGSIDLPISQLTKTVNVPYSLQFNQRLK